MAEKSIEQRVLDAVTDYMIAMGLPTDRVSLEANLSVDLDLDSLSKYELSMNIEDDFDILINDLDIAQFTSVQSIVDHLKTIPGVA